MLTAARKVKSVMYIPVKENEIDQRTKSQGQKCSIFKNEAFYGIALWAFLTLILAEIYFWRIGW